MFYEYKKVVMYIHQKMSLQAWMENEKVMDFFFIYRYPGFLVWSIHNEHNTMLIIIKIRAFNKKYYGHPIISFVIQSTHENYTALFYKGQY